MKYLLAILASLLLAVALGIFIKHDPGLVVLQYSGTTIQSPFSVFIVAIVIFVFILFILFYVITTTIRLPRRFKHWRQQRKYRRSEKFLTQGLLSMVEGNWQSAEDSFRKGANYSRLPIVNYLGAARAAQQQGDIIRRDHYLRLAHEYNPQASQAVSLTQAELQLSQSQTEQAYATLKRIDTEKPGLSQVKLMLLEASSELKDWGQVLALLQQLEGKRVLPIEEIRAKQLSAYAGLLRQAGQTRSNEKLNDEWNNIPKKLRHEIYLIEVYVEERLRFPDTADCEILLRDTLKKKWDSVLIKLYGEVQGSDKSRQLAFAEKQLSSRGKDPVLYLTLGRLCKNLSLWGRAKTYLDESIELQPSPEAYRELAALMEQQGEYVAAAAYNQEGLNLATNRFVHNDHEVKQTDNRKLNAGNTP